MLRLCSQRLLRRRPTFSPAIVGLRALRVVGVGRSKPMTKKAAAVAEPANVLERSSSAPNVAEARKVEPANESLVEAPPITMDEFRNSLTDWQPRNLDPSLLANAGKRPHTLLIDGQPVAFRSYYTIPATWKVKGAPVNALFGYVRIMLKLLKEYGAAGVPGAAATAINGDPVTHVAVILDHPGKTFRHEIDEEYKAHRPALPDDFKEQLARLPEATEAFNVATMRQPLYEADDLIATYAREASQLGHRVTIVSSDKDLMQLVTADVQLYDPMKKKLFGVDEVRSRYGVEPAQLVDVQALAGDSVDNVPGVKGIGMKTAAALIGQFGSLDALLANIDDVKQPARRKALEKHRDDALRSRELVRLDDRAPMPVPIEQLAYEFHLQRFVDYLEPMNFRSTIALVLRDAAADRQQKRDSASAAAMDISLIEDDHFFDLAEPALRTSQLIGEVPSAEHEAGPAMVPEAVSADDGLRELTDQEMEARCPDNVTLVRDVGTAQRVVDQLMKLTHNPDGTRRFHACDTEAIDVDLKKEGPIGKGSVICFSVYCGPDVDFGTGSCLFVDTLGARAELLEVFRPYFENEAIWKVWHNYGFDRHALGNHGIDVRGFGGDTMHMARLWDASRLFGGGGYSLEGLTRELLNRGKVSMKEIFGAKRVRQDGTEGSEVLMPSLDYLQRSKAHIYNWIDYAAYDAESTWLLRNELARRLAAMPWRWPDDELDSNDAALWVWRPDASRTTTTSSSATQSTHAATAGATTTTTATTHSASMLDLYLEQWRPYGELLTSMERRGIWLDRERLAALTPIAWHDRDMARSAFVEWARRYCPDVVHMNLESDLQKRQLFFAPCSNAKNKSLKLERSKEFKRDNVDGLIEPGKSKPLKSVSFTLDGFGLPPLEHSAGGWPRSSSAVLRKLAGEPSKGEYGKAFQPLAKLYGDSEAAAGCAALESLCDAAAISTLLSTFIEPLQSMADDNGRLHTSININTETGRLSSRRPNLQNQPALEKDRYHIRRCFAAEEGNVLIVADYGQLELRLLAHMSRCTSMIDAFATGGDFHSRTAIGMYPNIAAEVERGELLLEWDSANGQPPAPLLKDKYSTERRRAKTLNFSIAYGKTARGLAIDWETSVQEAKETVERWYSDRPEVRAWQVETVRRARITGYTKTRIKSGKRGEASHMARAAINTPLQGGAADVVMAAMLKIETDKRLRALGFRQLLQVHDELIIEGPEEHADEALAIVVELMSNPLDRKLLVDLVVDAKYAKTWGDAK